MERAENISAELAAGLLRTRDLILQDASRLDMDTWARFPFMADRVAFRQRRMDMDKAASCGAVCCLAGWFHFATPVERRAASPHDGETLRRALAGSGVPLYRLSDVLWWPPEFRYMHDTATDDAGRAAAAAMMIDDFLARGQ